jgi:hypothetical protein
VNIKNPLSVHNDSYIENSHVSFEMKKRKVLNKMLLNKENIQREIA